MWPAYSSSNYLILKHLKPKWQRRRTHQLHHLNVDPCYWWRTITLEVIITTMIASTHHWPALWICPSSHLGRPLSFRHHRVRLSRCNNNKARAGFVDVIPFIFASTSLCWRQCCSPILLSPESPIFTRVYVYLHACGGMKKKTGARGIADVTSSRSCEVKTAWTYLAISYSLMMSLSILLFSARYVIFANAHWFLFRINKKILTTGFFSKKKTWLGAILSVKAPPKSSLWNFIYCFFKMWI